jgi:hypothetical protein
LSWTRCCRGSSRCCCCRRGSSRCGGRSRGCWGWRRTWDASRGLDNYLNWRTSLKEAYCRIRRIGPLVGVKPEVIKSAEANRVRVLISRKGLRAPGDRAGVLGNVPRCAAITGVSDRAIVREAWMLRRRVKSDVSDNDSSSYRHAERLNSTIEVLIIDRVFIMPDACIRTCHFVTDEENAVASRRRPRSWLDRIAHRRAS